MATVDYSTKEKISAFYWLMRPLNSTTAAVAVVVAIHLAFGNNFPSINPISFLYIGGAAFFVTFLFVAGAAFFVTAHSMAHNDVVDYEVDKINSPHRALPSGKVSMKQAKIWTIILGLIAITFGLLIDFTIGIFPFSVFWAILNMAILDFYNLKLKQSGLFGNLVIGYVVSALFIYADIVVYGYLTWKTQSIGLYAFFLIWGREVHKDIIDIEGDKAHNIKTIPVMFGPRVGAIIGSFIIFLGVLSSYILILDPSESLLVRVVLFLLSIIIVFLSIRVILRPEKEVIFKSKLWLLRLLLIALLIIAVNQLVQIYLF